ncbi:MAG: FixH family protein [Myxococcota bacterium]
MLKNGLWFPLLITTLLVASVAGNVFMVMRAANDPGFAVEPDYYRKAVEWDRLQAERAQSNELGWNVVVDARKDELRIRMTDRLGRPIEGASVVVEAFFNARANDRVTAQMEPKGLGVYTWAHTFPQPGLWEYRLAAFRDADRFTYVTQQELP